MVLLALISLGIALCAYTVACRLSRDRSTAERLLMTGLLACTHIWLVSYTLAIFDQFFFEPVLVGTVLLGVCAVAFAFDRLSLVGLQTCVRNDLETLHATLQDFRHLEGVPWLLMLLAGATTFFISVAQAVYFPSSAWDVLWYHKPMTNVLIQTGSLDWVPTNIPHLNSFAKHTEVLSAFGVLLSGSTEVDDFPQLFSGLLGALAIAALSRRMNVSRGAALALGSAWLALPAVALQLHTTHADVSMGAFFLIAIYFSTKSTFDVRDQIFTCLAWGACVGTKGTGLFLMVLWGPVWMGRWLLTLRSIRSIGALQWIQSAIWGLAVLVYPGLYIYLDNVWKKGNPYWPLIVRVPIFGWQLPGEKTPESMGNFPPAFFDFRWVNVEKMAEAWVNTKGEFFSDIRSFPFGYVFPYLLLLALGVLLVNALVRLRKDQQRSFRWHMLALAVVSVMVPASWWGRFSLGLPAAGLVAFAALYTQLPWSALKAALTSCFVGLLLASWPVFSKGYRTFPSIGVSQQNAELNNDRIRQTYTWLWPVPLAQLRETKMRKGDLVLFDEDAGFTGEYWTSDVRNRVEYFPREKLSAEDYLKQARERGAKWLVVSRSSTVGEALKATDAPFVWVANLPWPADASALYQLK